MEHGWTVCVLNFGAEGDSVTPLQKRENAYKISTRYRAIRESGAPYSVHRVISPSGWRSVHIMADIEGMHAIGVWPFLG